ncbi:MAG: helix-turn-helix domain-containing protein [Crocinitomicaceae bacterium]
MAPRSDEQFEAMRLNTIQRITHSALQLFSEKGYKNTSVAEIAKRAGISKGLIYNYYDSKEGVLKGVIEGFRSMKDEIVQEGITIENALDQFFMMIEHQIGFVKMMMSFSLDVNEMPIVEEFVHEKATEGIKLYTPLLEKIGFEDPETEAWFLSTLLQGTAILTIVSHEDYPLEKMKKKIYQRYKINIK